MSANAPRFMEINYDTQIGVYVDHSLDVLIEHEKIHILKVNVAHLPHDGSLAIIPETQLNSLVGNKGAAYHAILASVRLDSPTTSQKHMEWGRPKLT